MYTLFRFGVNIEKHEISFPIDFVQALPPTVSSHRIKEYLPFSSHDEIFFCHDKRLAFCCFQDQEAFSSLGRHLQKLKDTLIDRARPWYVELPDAGTLRAAEVFDGGEEYCDTDVQMEVASNKVCFSYDLIANPWRPRTPPGEKERTEELVRHLQKFITEKNLPLTLEPPAHSSKSLCIFSGGGDVTIMSSTGCVVIGGTVTDEDLVTPLKEGDVATTSNLENKVPTNPQGYLHCQQQLFANMHLSASMAIISQLLKGTISPNVIERIVSYGTVLKPSVNHVALYKLVAPCNGNTYVQIDYSVQSLYWHPFFDRILLYTFNKLSH